MSEPTNRIDKYFDDKKPMTLDEYVDGIRNMVRSIVNVGQGLGVPVFTAESFPPLEEIQAKSEYCQKLELLARGCDEWARQLTLLAETCRSEI